MNAASRRSAVASSMALTREGRFSVMVRMPWVGTMVRSTTTAGLGDEDMFSVKAEAEEGERAAELAARHRALWVAEPRWGLLGRAGIVSCTDAAADSFWVNFGLTEQV